MSDMGDEDFLEVARLDRRRDALRAQSGHTPSRLPAREAKLRRAIARQEAELARLETEREQRAERFGEEPPRGTVIVFPRRYPGSYKTYEFAALRATSYWYLTGREAKEYSWSELCEFIGDAPFRVIPAPDAQPARAWTIQPGGKAVEFFPGRFDPATFQPAFGRFLDAFARSARKTGVVIFPDSGEPAPKSATEQALARLSPFIVGREPNGGRWQVLDERLQLQVDAVTKEPLDVIKTYPANDKGRARAHQSVRDRNKAYREQVRRLEVEPPVGSRVASADDARKWARRQEDGWVRYSDQTIVAVRLSWSAVKLALGAMRPGTPHSAELINGPGR
jgi:hypothetical protein